MRVRSSSVDSDLRTDHCWSNFCRSILMMIEGIPRFIIPATSPIRISIPTVTTADMRAQKGNPEFQYEIACAQLCGLGHARMRGFVTVQSAEEFQTWMDAAVKEAQASESDPFR